MTFLNEVNPVPQLISVVLYSHTRMHSSRMRTACTLPYGCLPDRDPPSPWIETTLDRDTPHGQRHPLARRTPWIEMGPLDRDSQTKTPWIETLLDREPLDRDLPGQRPPVNRITHRCKNISKAANYIFAMRTVL